MIKDIAQNKYGPASIFYSSIGTAPHLRIPVFHDLDIKRIDFYSDFCSNREHIGAMNKKLIIVCENFHFIVNPFEDQICDNSVDNSFSRSNKINVLRSDYSIYRFIMTKSDVYTVPDSSEYLYDLSSTIVAGRILLSPIKSATKAFCGSL